MKTSILFAFLLLFSALNLNAQTHCVNNGNLMLYTNYDGGILNINVDQNIPNLKIGICSYEPVQVNISGAYVGNITQVLYAGFNSTQNNNHCNQVGLVTAINGVPNNISQIITYPPVDYPSSNGSPNIICAYSCDTANNQGGCNTVDQVVHYFMAQTNGVLYAHYIQYGCWSGTYNISAGGTCCIQPPNTNAPTAAFALDSTGFCPGYCIDFTNNSTGGPFTSVEWSFPGGTPSSSTDENPSNICYNTPGLFPVTLIVSNANGTDTITYNSLVNVVNPVLSAGFTYTQIDNYTTNFTNTSVGGSSYLWQFPNSTTSTLANPSYDFPVEGIYPVSLIAYGPCSTDTVTHQVIIEKLSTGVNENELKGFSLFPNPGANMLNINLPVVTANTVVEIIDPLGKVVARYNNLQGQNLQLDCTTLAPGTYLVSIKTNGKTGKKVWVKL